MRVQKHVLEQILCFLRRSGHPERQAIEAPRMLAVQLLEGAGVALPAPLGQFEVGGSHVV